MDDRSPFWSPLLHRLVPYRPGEQRRGAGIVKLNTNENPYPPSSRVMQAIANVPANSLNRYPDPEAQELRQALAQYHGLSPEQVFVGNGSDEILALAFMAFFTGDGYLQYPAISYAFYPVYCDLLGIKARKVALEQDFTLNVERFDHGVDSLGVVFPNPNAPTSRALSANSIDTLARRCADRVVLVDEAYAGFGASSVVSRVNDLPNLLVSQTFSKARSLAGLRLGVAYGSAPLIEALNRVKNSFNSYPVDVVAQRAGIASIADEAWFQSCLEKIVTTRESAAASLCERGFQVLPSSANFLFASPPGGRAAALYAWLDTQDVLVRYWSVEPLSRWLRISVGTDDDMQRLLEAIDGSLVSKQT